MGKLLWLILGAALTIYLVMVVWSLPFIAAQAGGLVPFDMRPTGYSGDEARAFLGALSAEGKTFYLGTQHMLDRFYPGLMGVALAMAIVMLFARVPVWLRYGLAATAIIGAGFDYLENARVAGMLRAAIADVSDADIAAASQATLLKSGFDTVAMVAALVGLVMLWLRKRKEKPA